MLYGLVKGFRGVTGSGTPLMCAVTPIRACKALVDTVVCKPQPYILVFPSEL